MPAALIFLPVVQIPGVAIKSGHYTHRFTDLMSQTRPTVYFEQH